MSTTKDRPMTVPSLKSVALGDLEQELATTRRVLERLPEDKLGWKPHVKSMTLGELARHVATIPYYGVGVCASDEYDIATAPRNSEGVKSRAELLENFDSKSAALQEALVAQNDETLGELWTFRAGEHVIFTAPRAAALRKLVISHIVHHRAQLSVYLRLLDVPVPSIYGPSADEPNF
jgi:uncharacterized damage-inducible protein DinB